MKSRIVLSTFAIFVLLASLAPASVGAATITVTSLADDGGADELRAAITAANASVQSTITFQNGLAGTIALASSLPPITASTAIQGPGASDVAVDGAGKYRVLCINNAGGSVTLSGLTIQHGNDTAGDGYGGGGILLLAGNLSITNCAVTGNTAETGGGICNNDGMLTLTSCTLSGNSAGDAGGGLANRWSATLTDCTLAGNTASTGGGIAGSATLANCTLVQNSATGPYGGGGIYVVADPTAIGVAGDAGLTLTNCTLTGNTATGQYANGGGVFIEGSSTVALTNCTLSGNVAGGYGGGTYATAGNALTLTSCTLTENAASVGGGVYASETTALTNCTLYGNIAQTGAGGGIFVQDGSAKIVNCTLTGNAANGHGSGIDGQCALTNCILYGDPGEELNAEGYTVSVTYSDVEGGYSGTGNQSANPLFDASGLANNGGPTETIALQPGSPCSGAGTATGAPATDQRGVPRPDPPSMGAYDVGQVQLAPTPAPTISPNGGAVSVGQTVTITDALSGATIYYTTNGTTPTAASPSYDGPITVSNSETIRAIAVASGYSNSVAVAASFTVDISLPAAPTPVMSPTGGTVAIGQTVTITDPLNGAAIYYTTNGTTPSAASTLYSGPITVTTSETITAIAVASGHTNSAAASAAFTTVFHTFAAGIQLFSVPYDYSASGLEPNQILVGLSASKLAVWVPAQSVYEMTPNYPSDTVRLGQGYWARFVGTVTVTTEGMPPPAGGECSISLNTGWNMVGCAQSTSVALGLLTAIDSAGTLHSFAGAVSSGLISGTLFTYQPGDTAYEAISVPTGSLKPYYGYWLYAHQPCSLVFPAQ